MLIPACFLALMCVDVPSLDGEEVPRDLVQAELLADAAAVEPGGTFTLGVRFTIKPEWHIYWLNPGDSGIATSVKLTLPEGYEVGELEWPVPERFETDGQVNYGYERELLLTAKVRVPETAKPGEPLSIKARADWLSCKVSCVPGDAELSLALAVDKEARPANEELFRTWRARLPGAAGGPAGPVEVRSEKIGRVSLKWRGAVKDVEIYPATTSALVLTSLAVSHASAGEGAATEIAFNPDIYDAAAIPGGMSRLLVVYRDKMDKRRGVWVPVQVLDKQ